MKKLRRFTAIALLSAGGMTAAGAASAQSILDIAASDPRFSTLAAAVEAAGMEGILDSASPMTVFAPTNEAFDNLPAGTVDNLLRPENVYELRKVINQHITYQNVSAQELEGGFYRIGSGNLWRNVANGAGPGVKIGDATVIEADVGAQNGTVHVIDEVLLP